MEHPEDTTRAVAAVIRGRLEANGTSLRAASLETGIPLTTLSRRLTGLSPFTIPDLARFAHMFESTVSGLAAEAERLAEVDAA